MKTDELRKKLLGGGDSVHVCCGMTCMACPSTNRWQRGPYPHVPELVAATLPRVPVIALSIRAQLGKAAIRYGASTRKLVATRLRSDSCLFDFEVAENPSWCSRPTQRDVEGHFSGAGVRSSKFMVALGLRDCASMTPDGLN